MIHITNQNFTTKEVIQNVFSPLIGAICSPQAEELCHKNNLNFVEMLQPFSKLSADAHFRDTSGSSVSIKGLRLNICDVNWRPPQTILARKMLNESVTTAQCDKTRVIEINAHNHLEIPFNEPWFDQWRETFLTVQFPSDHEYTRHFICCLVVISSADPNPLESANSLTKKIQMMQNVTPPKLPKWFSTDVLNCYVMLHEGSSADISKAQQGFESLKSTFGDNKCFLLQINSHEGAPVDTPDPWLRYLKRHHKTDQVGSAESDSAPRTPQDMGSVSSMPNMQMTTETPPSGIITGDVVVAHPLSPAQETGVDILQNHSLSTSTDSLSTQQINPNVWSASETEIDVPHGTLLTSGDIENLRHFVQDFTVRALIPYVEKIVGVLNDAIANKKGVSRSLLSATKRWFVTNKPGVNSSQNAVVYTTESTELQTRKLGDIYFMFGYYSLAFQAYHQAKRDFNADSAWQYYAGALEMAALSAFMQGNSNRKTYDYMEEAIVTYLNICKLPQFATRATLLSVECLKSVKLYGEAAKQLIRMTSEDSDLRSALLLEQAAYCYLSAQPPLYRKYAFHSVLSGHRYSKAGQRKHSFRTYKQAYQVFSDRNWSLAEDHIQYTIGKQAVTLKKLDEASNALAHLLRPSSLQSSTQQAAFLREYIATQKTLLNQSEIYELFNIALPKIVQNSTKVLVTSPPPSAKRDLIPATNLNINTLMDDEIKWNKLEEMLVHTTTKKPIMIFKPTKSLFTSELANFENPLSINGEPIDISFVLENTIKPIIQFDDINLLWEFKKESTGEIYSNRFLFGSDAPIELKKEIENVISSTSISTILFNEFERQTVNIKLVPNFNGYLRIKGVAGRISIQNEPTSLWGKLDFEQIPIKTKDSNVEKIIYDKKLEIQILPAAPVLHVVFSKIPQEVLAGEIIPITVQLTNAGVNVLNDVYVAIENPRFVSINPDDAELPLSILGELRNLSNENLSKEKETRKQYVFKLFKQEDNSAINPNETKTTKIWLQAPFKKGSKDIKILFYYSMPEEYPKLRYRLIRHTWHLNVNESINVDANCNIGNMKTKEIGVDLIVKNLNQEHHSLMTEIMINEITLYCSSYQLNKDKIVYMKNPGYNRIFLENKGLKSNEALSLRCGLTDNAATTTQNNIIPKEFVKNKTSNISIRGNKISDQFSGNFLIKNETKFIQLFNLMNTSNEEFNNIMLNISKHMTLCVSWKAIVYDNGTIQRGALGQHFVQMKHLFETVHCPPRNVLFVNSEELLSIYNFKEKLLNNSNIQDDFNDDEDDDSSWAVHNVCVSRRCFLEEDSQSSEYVDGNPIRAY